MYQKPKMSLKMKYSGVNGRLAQHWVSKSFWLQEVWFSKFPQKEQVASVLGIKYYIWTTVPHWTTIEMSRTMPNC